MNSGTSAHIQRRRSRIAMVTASNTKVTRKGRLCWKLLGTFVWLAVPRGKQYEGDQEGTALLEVAGHRAGGDGGREAAIEPAGAPPNHQPHQSAEGDEEHGAQQHQAGES